MSKEEQIQEPKQAKAFRKVAGFMRTTRSVLTHPRAFFAEYFHSTIPSTERQQSNPLSTFDYLGIAIGLAAIVAPLHRALLRAGNFPESFLELAERGAQGLVENYERMTGQDIDLINLTQLTGISLVDSPIEDIARMGIYAMFAALFWAFSSGRLPLRRTMGYFAYSLGACLVVETAFLLAGDVIFVLLSDGDSETGFFAASTVQELGYIPRLIYLFVVPTLIFPAILGIRRGAVLVTTVLSAGAWGLAGMLISQIMLSSGILIITPGL